jgi:DNA-directed RNA polymerase I subunit RPA49
MRQRRNELGQTFGTKKSRKAIASVTENAISPDKSLRKLANGEAPKLDSTGAAIIANMAEATKGMSSKDDLAKKVDDAKPRPKANMNATEIANVYTIDSLIGIDTMKLIPVMQWQESIKNNKEITTASCYVARRLGMTRPESTERLKILRYMLLLLDVYNNAPPARGMRKWPSPSTQKTFLGNVPEAVLEGVKRRFADQGMITKYTGDLLITHLCAMACLVDNYEVDLWDLKEDLKLEMKQMAQYFSEIGAKIGMLSEGEKKRLGLDRAAAAQHKVAKLKLPLDFPKVSFGRRR